MSAWQCPKCGRTYASPVVLRSAPVCSGRQDRKHAAVEMKGEK